MIAGWFAHSGSYGCTKKGVVGGTWSHEHFGGFFSRVFLDKPDRPTRPAARDFAPFAAVQGQRPLRRAGDVHEPRGPLLQEGDQGVRAAAQVSAGAARPGPGEDTRGEERGTHTTLLSRC